jgi:hypothetical protein
MGWFYSQSNRPGHDVASRNTSWPRVSACQQQQQQRLHVQYSRTGRAGNTGTEVTFATLVTAVPDQDRYAAFLVKGFFLNLTPCRSKPQQISRLWPTNSTRSPGRGVTSENAPAGHSHPFENEQETARPVVASEAEAIDPLPNAAIGQAEEGRIASRQNSTGGSAAAPRARSATTVSIPTHLSIDPRNTS